METLQDQFTIIKAQITETQRKAFWEQDIERYEQYTRVKEALKLRRESVRAKLLNL